MVFEKIWKDNLKLNETEKKKLVKDGLKIYDDIPYYAENGFESIPKDQWDLFKWAGCYLQKPKEAGYFMMRVNVPSGILTHEQLITLAEIARDYGRDVYDITTRQAIQFHWLTIDQIPDIFTRLEKVGLSSAGACGDITRNIVGNPLAGIDPNELFDTTPIVKEIYEFFQFNEEFSNLPRKYKMSISTNKNNASNAEINCISFIPAIKEIDGKETSGFHLKVGGGLSSAPHLAQELDVFLLPHQVKEVAIAVTTIFRDYGYREKRHHSRLKFLVADWGVEKFKEVLEGYTGKLLTKGTGFEESWNAGYFYGVQPQKQEGLNYVGLSIPVGRLHSKEVFELARIVKKYGNGEIRNCNSQNLILPNIPTENIDELLKEPILEKFTPIPPKFIGYSVACTGNEYCNLALVETKARMKDTAAYLDEKITLDVPVRIHMVGCPNSCGQRAIADIGLQGIKARNDKKELVEAFEIYVGGTLANGGKLNEKLKGKVESPALHLVLEKFLQHFSENKLPSETFLDYVSRIGIEELQTYLTSILETVNAS
ncbi:ferredoxin--nitrite reductase [Bacillus sp. AFS053548]|uniref:nitrite/sulfite reductase n=1 Tax=Bacillus sp. AFS053548 TaxID=2033505 RepID=UPI000BFD10C9|nr:ferredoxin--nitrite reductase [Bacillus sp. AFS053548]PGM52636.1 ferredoxin--nitrite reductase [Bacillus sp. AFS053548]